MLIYSWNVNGLRACARKGFLDWLNQCNADLVCLQEVRAKPEQLSKELREPEGWHTHFVMAERPGYSGVAFYSRIKPDELETSLKQEDFDREGRLQLFRFGKLLIANVYFPNGSGKNRDNSRVPFKLDFYRCLFDQLEEKRKNGEHIIVLGDFNTAHQEKDLARPKANHKTSGFLPEERAELTRLLESGWVDSFRAFQSEGGHYTWWSQRQGARERNVGWRIDLALASTEAMSFVKTSSIHPGILGSDHCPISIELNSKII